MVAAVCKLPKIQSLQIVSRVVPLNQYAPPLDTVWRGGLILIICLWYLRGIYSSEHVRGDKTLSLVRSCPWLPWDFLDVQLSDAAWGGLCRHQHPWKSGGELGGHRGEDGKEKLGLGRPTLLLAYLGLGLGWRNFLWRWEMGKNFKMWKMKKIDFLR